MVVIFLIFDKAVTDDASILYILDRLNTLCDTLISKHSHPTLSLYFNRGGQNSNVLRFLMEKGLEVYPLFIQKTLGGMVKMNLPTAPYIKAVEVVIVESRRDTRDFKILKEDVERYPRVGLTVINTLK